MSKISKLFAMLTLFTMMTLTIATPAHAFDGRSGDKININSGDTINDDLYVTGSQFVMDGTVNGDVVAFAQTVTINGTINGSLIAAAQTVIVNGTVTGSIRMAGSVLNLGDKARVGGDVVSSGYSLEARKGSTVGRDVVYAGGQILLSGMVTRNVTVGTGGLEIAGTIGGNVVAEVGESGRGQAGPPPSTFMPESPVSVPLINTGLTIDSGAKIGGTLEYTQTKDLTFPSGVVAGAIARKDQPKTQGRTRLEQTSGEKVVAWAFNLLRSLVTFALVGMLLLWLFPFFLKRLSETVASEPLPSLGWGVVSLAALCFSILVIFFLMILGAILFGVLSLWSLSATVIMLGSLSFFAVVLGFALVILFLAKVIFGIALGKWLLERAKSPLADHRFWPMLLGVAVMLIAIALLSFPLIPGFLGGLLNIVIVLIGLGAVWIWGREALPKKPVVPAA